MPHSHSMIQPTQLPPGQIPWDNIAHAIRVKAAREAGQWEKIGDTMHYCQYCNDGPYSSEIQKKIHEQSFCNQRPPEQQVDTSAIEDGNGKSGHEIDEETKEEWQKEHNRVTRLVFYSPDPNLMVSKRLQAKLDRVTQQRERKPQHIFFTGEAGTGKSSIARQYAAVTKSPCYFAPCPTMTEVSQWMGRTEFAPERGTFYTPALHVEALETPYSVVIYNDVTRVENPKVLNPLMDILSEGVTWCEELGRQIKVAKGVVFIATANVGWEYTGADDPDKALKGRFDVIELSLPPEDVLSEIVKAKVGSSPEILLGIDFFLACVRKGLPLSVRHMLRLCDDIKYGASLADAALLGMLGDLLPEQREEALQILQIKASSTGDNTELLEVEDTWSRYLG